ncbi:hypothetical protein PAMA_008808 [Pampus argenteus]
MEQAREEIAFLKHLQCLDPNFWTKAQRDHQGLSTQELSPVVHQLATALSHLRSMGPVHTDLKPDNIMVMNNQQQPLKVKLIDFAPARHVSAAEQTTWYRAPEVMLHVPFNKAIDMWSLGVVAAEMTTGYRCILEKQTQAQPDHYVLDRGKRK